ncbi:uncharacterized protein [Ptychodera flava]|uniref:uncharacterized protein n=1 Tax=Ptychodera flava TaxID=63121 RepID=UPI00396A47EF
MRGYLQIAALFIVAFTLVKPSNSHSTDDTTLPIEPTEENDPTGPPDGPATGPTEGNDPPGIPGGSTIGPVNPTNSTESSSTGLLCSLVLSVLLALLSMALI